METPVARRLQALITQNHMVDMAGSEILTLELAEALQHRGYEVNVFSHVVGDPIARLARERGIALTDDQASLDELPMDLAWIHHQVVPDSLASKLGGAHTIVVFGHMSPFEPLELPFLADIESRLADVVVANSDETASVLGAFGIDEVPVIVLGNPAPDSFWQMPASRPTALRRLLVVTNHAPDELREAIGRLTAEGLEVAHIGAHGRIAAVTPEEIAAADAVVTIGKTVQYALAVGRAVFCYDVHGGPGWLSMEHLPLAREHNFSGRPFGRMSAEEIVASILDGYERANSDVDFLRNAVSGLTLSRRLQLVLETAADSKRLKGQLSQADKRRIGAYFALAGRSIREHYALASSDAHLIRAQVELAANAAQLADIYSSTSWRLSSPVRLAGRLSRRAQSGRVRREAGKLARLLAPSLVQRHGRRNAHKA